MSGSPLDLVIRNARLPRAAGLTDIAIRDGYIVEATAAAGAARETLDAAGSLVTAALVAGLVRLLLLALPELQSADRLFHRF